MINCQDGHLNIGCGIAASSSPSWRSEPSSRHAIPWLWKGYGARSRNKQNKAIRSWTGGKHHLPLLIRLGLGLAVSVRGFPWAF